MAATKYQIFVSSTFDDLEDERNQVIRAVLEMGNIPVGMEMFSAADDEQWRIITRHIDESDYYALIVGHRYGSLAGEISYTRKEYEYALSVGVPVLGFIIDDGASWPADRVDRSDASKKLLDDFKSLVKKKPVSFWTSAEELHGKFTVALMKAITANPRDGWIRATGAIGPEVAAEISRLSSENAELRKRLEQAKSESETQQELDLIRLDEQLSKAQITLSYRYAGSREWEEAERLEHGVIFEMLAPSLLIEVSVKETASFLALNLKKNLSRRSDIVPLNQVQEVFAAWMALGLVEPSTRKHSVNDSAEYWSLTQLGKNLHSRYVRQDWARRADEAVSTVEPESASLSDDSGEEDTAPQTGRPVASS